MNTIEKFIKKYKLSLTDANIFTEKLINKDAQQRNSDINKYSQTDNVPYFIRQEMDWIKKQNSNIYAGAYEVIDHYNRFYSTLHDCYVLSAQPYHFHKNIKKIKKTIAYFNLSFTVFEDQTWHSKFHDCTLYCIGSYKNLLNVFGKVDFKGDKT